MKKLLTLALFTFFAIASQAQITVLHDTVSKVWTKDGITHALKDTLVNNTAAPITVTWNKTNEILLTGWSYIGICDKITCYPAPVTGSHSFTIDPGEKVAMYVDVKAIATADDGFNYITVKLNDGISDKYMTFEFYTWPTQVKDFENNNTVSIYPNPATNFINLNILDSRITDINVVNIIGKKIGHYDITASTPNPMRVPIDNIAKGIYLLQFTDNNGKLIGIKRVTKQ